MSNKIIIFDLWQTLADSAIKPSDLFDSLFLSDKDISKADFLNILFKSSLYIKDISLEEGLNSFLKDFNIFDKKKLEKAILIWKEMSKKSYVFEGSENLLLKLKLEGYGTFGNI